MAIVRPLDGPERREWESYRPLERRWLGVLLCAPSRLAATPRAEAGYLLKFTGTPAWKTAGSSMGPGASPSWIA